MSKTTIEDRIIAVQPRIRLLRSFDQRQHNYPGYALLIKPLVEQNQVWIGVGPAAHAKFGFCAGGSFSAEVEPVANPDLEAVDYYKETFCYGPKSCPNYRPGPVREVPGRNGTTWTEEDWADEDATSHRGPDD